MLAFFCIFLLSGCSDSGRGYQLPGNLCGIKISPETVAPFLPNGKELSENDWTKSADSANSSCALSVDGSEELNITGSWELQSTLKKRLYGINYPTRIHDGKYIVGERAAATHFSCFNPKARLGTPTPPGEKHKTVPADTYVIEVDARSQPEDREESKKAMERFIVPFTKELKKQLPCQERE